jgi:hypothetical protein
MLYSTLTSFLFFSYVFAYDFHSNKLPINKVGVAKLNYYGGLVIPNVKVITYWWGGGSSVQYASQLEKFYGGVTNSNWFKIHSEYSTSNQTIGMGSWALSFNDKYAPTGVLTDAQIQSRLLTMINNGSLPAVDSNTYYAIHFIPGISISSNGGSCVAGGFCAYHGTINSNGKYIYYGVLPDQGGGCATGCGTNANPFNNLCSVASHELSEAVTDPGIGLASTYAPPLAWYDPNNGEIGDICNAQQGTTVGGDNVTYTVQKIFSNKANACIVAAVNPSTSTTNFLSSTTASTTKITTFTSTPTTTNSPTITTTTKTTTKTTTTTTKTTTISSPTPSSSCAHSKCVTGAKLVSSCDTCVSKIISKDSYCGTIAWDSVCVSEVKSVCGISPCI